MPASTSVLLPTTHSLQLSINHNVGVAMCRQPASTITLKLRSSAPSLAPTTQAKFAVVTAATQASSTIKASSRRTARHSTLRSSRPSRNRSSPTTPSSDVIPKVQVAEPWPRASLKYRALEVLSITVLKTAEQANTSTSVWRTTTNATAAMLSRTTPL